MFRGIYTDKYMYVIWFIDDKYGFYAEERKNIMQKIFKGDKISDYPLIVGTTKNIYIKIKKLSA